MTNQNTNGLENIVAGMKKLIEEGEYKLAKEKADELCSKGYQRELICKVCWPIMEKFIRSDRKKVEELGSVFKEYNFHYWLISIKNTDGKTYLNKERQI